MTPPLVPFSMFPLITLFLRPLVDAMGAALSRPSRAGCCRGPLVSAQARARRSVRCRPLCALAADQHEGAQPGRPKGPAKRKRQRAGGRGRGRGRSVQIKVRESIVTLVQRVLKDGMGAESTRLPACCPALFCRALISRFGLHQTWRLYWLFHSAKVDKGRHVNFPVRPEYDHRSSCQRCP